MVKLLFKPKVFPVAQTYLNECALHTWATAHDYNHLIWDQDDKLVDTPLASIMNKAAQPSASRTWLDTLAEYAGRFCYRSFARGRPSVEYLRNILQQEHGCYDGETDVLTKNGWKNWSDVDANDEFATRTTDGHIEYHKPIDLYRAPYKGRMYRVESKSVDLLVTPNHNMYVCKMTSRESLKKENYSLIRADSLNHSRHAYVKDGVYMSGYVAHSEEWDVLWLLGFTIGDGTVSG